MLGLWKLEEKIDHKVKNTERKNWMARLALCVRKADDLFDFAPNGRKLKVLVRG